MEARKEEIMQAVARGWCSEKNSHKTMDTDLAMAITEEVFELPIVPNRTPTEQLEYLKQHLSEVALDDILGLIELSKELTAFTFGAVLNEARQ